MDARFYSGSAYQHTKPIPQTAAPSVDVRGAPAITGNTAGGSARSMYNSPLAGVWAADSPAIVGRDAFHSPPIAAHPLQSGESPRGVASPFRMRGHGVPIAANEVRRPTPQPAAKWYRVGDEQPIVRPGGVGAPGRPPKGAAVWGAGLVCLGEGSVSLEINETRVLMMYRCPWKGYD